MKPKGNIEELKHLPESSRWIDENGQNVDVQVRIVQLESKLEEK